MAIQTSPSVLSELIAEDMDIDYNPISERKVTCFPKTMHNQSISPDSRRYHSKKLLLAEKAQCIEKENYMLLLRLKQIRKQCIRMKRLKRTLCKLLDEQGDPYYKTHLELTDEDQDKSQQQLEHVHVTTNGEPRKSNGKPSIRAVKTRLPEDQKDLEKERQKIVSIIDSVLNQNARTCEKSGKQDECYTKSSGEQDLPHVTKTNASVERPFIPYRMVAMEMKERKNSSSIPAQTAEKRRKVHTGEVGGLTYTFLSNEPDSD